jgi:hypothetical protein
MMAFFTLLMAVVDIPFAVFPKANFQRKTSSLFVVL